MLAGRQAAVTGLFAPPLHHPPRRAGCPVSTPAALLQRGLAEFSVGEAHQTAAVTAGPAYGSHLRGGRRPDRDALERRPGTRGAEERPRQARQRSARAPERRPWRRPRTPLRSCPSAAEACADVASVRSAVAAVAPARVRGSSFRALPGGGPRGCGVLCARGPPGGQLTDLPKP